MFRSAIFLGSCLAALSVFAQEKPSTTDIGLKPWVPSPAPSQPKVIYGTDDRIDVYQETDPERLAMAAATCAIVFNSALQQHEDGSYTLAVADWQVLNTDPCEAEPFSNQPEAGQCSAFLVGPNLVATAGHCFSSATIPNGGDVVNKRFVFGFVMQDSDTPVTEFEANQVYRGVEIVGRRLTNFEDYAIIRLDRNVTAPGAQPLLIRREGVVPLGTPVGVIGHPAGLPMKIAFGPTTAVRENDRTEFFVANLDTYGGNSGSPVFNAETGIVEGILVRGDEDYVFLPDCFVSNRQADNVGRGEDVTKTSLFMEFVPEFSGSSGTVAWSQTSYGCDALASITVADADLEFASGVTVNISSSSGDSESLVLVGESGNGIFSMTLGLSSAAAVPNNGVLTVAEGGSISVTYEDAQNGGGVPATVSDTASIDCTAPVITEVSMSFIGSSQAVIAFETNEAASGAVLYGADCSNLSAQASAAPAIAHLILLNNLTPETEYFFSVQATDAAGNSGTDNQGGLCYSFTTTPMQDFLTQQFLSGAKQLAGRSIELTPNGSTFSVCSHAITELPTPPGGQSLNLGDDGSVEIAIEDRRTIPFYGVDYERIFVNANGNITFTGGSSVYNEGINEHFLTPRVSVLFDDFKPETGGEILVRQFADRLVVSWVGIHEINSALTSTFQAELFFSGVIVMSYEAVSADDAVVGLSPGVGTPQGFLHSNFLGYSACGGLTNDFDSDGLSNAYETRFGLNPRSPDGDDGPGADVDEDGLTNAEEAVTTTHPLRADSDRDGVNDGDEVDAGSDPTGALQAHTADLDNDREIAFSELLRGIQLYNGDGYHCSSGGEDGYELGEGTEDCLPHHSDFGPQDWAIDLAEILRLIQFFNAGGYARDLASEDSFVAIAK